jgi:hypothetical protein
MFFFALRLPKPYKVANLVEYVASIVLSFPNLFFFLEQLPCESMLTSLPTLFPCFLCIEIVKTLKRLFVGLDYC